MLISSVGPTRRDKILFNILVSLYQCSTSKDCVLSNWQNCIFLAYSTLVLFGGFHPFRAEDDDEIASWCEWVANCPSPSEFKYADFASDKILSHSLYLQSHCAIVCDEHNIKRETETIGTGEDIQGCERRPSQSYQQTSGVSRQRVDSSVVGARLG